MITGPDPWFCAGHDTEIRNEGRSILVGAPLNLDAMVDVPVTLRVQAYKRVFNVTYPSLRRVQDLVLEFATQCKGDRKPGAKRRFFVCIHCGKSNFSNKLRLNHHRFEVGCGSVKYPDGTPARLLPYPDFLPGEGKMVEVMGRLAAGRYRRGSKTKAGDGGETCSGGDDDALKEDFADVLPSKRPRSSVKGRGTRPPPPDMLCGAAPPKVGARKPRAKRRKPSPNAQIRPETDPEAPAQGSPQRFGTARGLTELFPRADDPPVHTEYPRTPEPLLPLDEGEGTLGRRCVRGDVIEGKRIRGAVSRQQNSTALTLLERPESVLPRTVASVRASRPPQLSTEDGVSPSVLGEEAVSSLNVADADAFGESPVRKSPRVVRHERQGAWHEEKAQRPGFADGRNHTVYMSSQEEKTEPEECAVFDGARAAGAMRGMYPDTQAADLAQPSVVAEGLGVPEDNVLSEDVTMVVNDVLSDIQRNLSPCASPTSSLIRRDVSLEDAVASFRACEEDLEPTPELLLFWATGRGSPQPFDHHPRMEARFVALRNELMRQESLHVALKRRKAAESLSSGKPPTPPDPVPIPGLYHLQSYGDEVALPWSFDHPSGEAFRQHWEDSFSSREFRDRLQGCLWWWTAKKVGERAR